MGAIVLSALAPAVATTTITGALPIDVTGGLGPRTGVATRTLRSGDVRIAATRIAAATCLLRAVAALRIRAALSLAATPPSTALALARLATGTGGYRGVRGGVSAAVVRTVVRTVVGSIA